MRQSPIWKLAAVGQYWTLLLLYLVLGCAKQPQNVVGSYNDLFMHFIGYAVAGLSISLAYPKLAIYNRASYLWLFSTAIELIQYFLPWRSFELWDMLANSGGIIVGLIIAYVATQLLVRVIP